MLLPKDSRKRSQGSRPAGSATCTNGENAGDDRSVNEVPRECNKQIYPGKLKVLTCLQPGGRTLVAAQRVTMLFPWQSHEETQGSQYSMQLSQSKLKVSTHLLPVKQALMRERETRGLVRRATPEDWGHPEK